MSREVRGSAIAGAVNLLPASAVVRSVPFRSVAEPSAAANIVGISVATLRRIGRRSLGSSLHPLAHVVESDVMEVLRAAVLGGIMNGHSPAHRP